MNGHRGKRGRRPLNPAERERRELARRRAVAESIRSDPDYEPPTGADPVVDPGDWMPRCRTAVELTGRVPERPGLDWYDGRLW